MNVYKVIIGGRELQIAALDATTAVAAAMAQRPGELVTGYALIGPYEAPESPEEPSE